MWLYERGNQSILVENAYGSTLDGDGLNLVVQERVSVNGERIRDCIPMPKSLLRWTDWYQDTIISGSDLVPICVQVKSGLFKVKARLLIDNEPVRWTTTEEASWTGPLGVWPSWDGPSDQPPGV